MDLIYADAGMQDIGVLHGSTFDLEFGENRNDFACRLNMKDHCCNHNYYLYIEDTEYGGIIDKVTVDTSKEEVTYEGRTWHGLLDSKIICPDIGKDYYTVSGDANDVIAQIVQRIGLTEIFSASSKKSGIEIKYTMNRYIGAYSGMRKMLESVGAKLRVIHKVDRVELSAVPLIDYSKDEEWDSSQITFVMSKNVNPVNHMICLGKGELAERQVVHLYADKDGRISDSQSLSGANEVMATYDNPNAESLEDLKRGGEEAIQKEIGAAETLQVNFDGSQNYDVGDVVGAREEVTGMVISRPVVAKIVTINKNGANIEYKVGDQ